MALYGLVDVKMRMLKIPELKRIMGFPANYKLVGTQAEQKKFIGNAVEEGQLAPRDLRSTGAYDFGF